MSRWKITYLFILLAHVCQAQQLPMQNQYVFNLTSVNAAYAGSQQALIAALAYRHQWVGFEGAPVTQQFTLHSPVGKGRVGLGLMVDRESIGAHQKTSVAGIYAYHLPVGNGKLSMALRAGALQYQFDWNKISYKESSDPIVSYADGNRWVPVFDFAAMYYNRKGYVGIETSQLNNSEIIASADSDARLYPHITLVAGNVFDVHAHWGIRPSVLVRQVSGSPLQVEANVFAMYKEAIWLGAAYRYQYGLSAMMQFAVWDKLYLGYAYDFPVRYLNATAAGSHEVFISYNIRLFQADLASPRYF